MQRRTALVLLLAGGLLLAACGGETPPAEQAPEPTPEPTKARLVQTLRDLLAALEAGDDAQALTCLFPRPGIPPEDLPDLLAGFLKRGEISADGIDYLEKHGAFGELDDLFRDRGKALAAQAGVNENHCYALTEDDAEVAAFWDGERFLLLLVDDVGKQK